MGRRPLNSEFGMVVVPLMRPMYILQMARSKSWSKEARRRYLYAFVEACDEARDNALLLIQNIDEETRRERRESGTPSS